MGRKRKSHRDQVVRPRKQAQARKQTTWCSQRPGRFSSARGTLFTPNYTIESDLKHQSCSPIRLHTVLAITEAAIQAI